MTYKVVHPIFVIQNARQQVTSDSKQIKADYAEVRRSMINLLAEYNRLKTVHDNLYAQHVANTENGDLLVTADQIAIIFGISQDTVEKKIATGFSPKSFTTNDLGHPAIKFESAKAMAMELSAETKIDSHAVSVIRALCEIPGMTNTRLAAAANLSLVQVLMVKARLQEEARDIVQRMTREG